MESSARYRSRSGTVCGPPGSARQVCSADSKGLVRPGLHRGRFLQHRAPGRVPMHPTSHRSGRTLSATVARRGVLVVAVPATMVVTAASTVALALTPSAPSAPSRSHSVAVESGLHTSGHCRREAQLVTDALRRSSTKVDVDGDSRLDRVAVATDPRARRTCRAFVAVDLQRGSAYSATLDRSAVPGARAPEPSASPWRPWTATATR